MKGAKYVVLVDSTSLSERKSFTYLNFKSAVMTYMELREKYNDNVRLLKVILDYGEEV